MKAVIFKRAMLPAFALVLGGCAGYTPRVDVAEVPTLNDAYLYGRFHMDAPKAWLSMDGHQTMGFSIQCADNSKYVVRFDRDQPLLAIKLKPSTCTWAEIIYSNADGEVRSRKPAPASLFRGMPLQGGYAYYLGDFDAVTSTSVSGNTIHTEWSIKTLKDAFEITTKDMRAAYPNLATLPVENRMLGYMAVPKAVEITEAQVRAEYDRVTALMGDKEYKVRHILVETQDQARAALSRIKGGEPFDAVAKAVSKDPGSSDKGGDLGWNVPSNFVDEFAASMRQLAPASLVKEPVKSQFGWHVIEVTEQRARVVPPYEEVKDRMAERMRKKAQQSGT